ncbi:MAG: PhzF family phenazine biosynthesis protein [Actinomycetota bacterium]|nr:PhzF family phenazine biosynthesis protein [Actinomycetota bacterium]
MPHLVVLSVFTGPDGDYGNELGIVTDGKVVPDKERQAVAARLGFSETVFIDDLEKAELRLYTPAAELPYAGHPLVGVGWWLAAHRGRAVVILRPPVGDVPTSMGATGMCWIEGQPEWCPPWQHVRLRSPAAVATATGPPPGHDAVQVWAFIDEQIGLVRARVFAPRFGVREDEACGSASQLLSARLGRPLTINHGNGSEIFVQPGRAGTIELGGRVRWRSERTLHL